MRFLLWRTSIPPDLPIGRSGAASPAAVMRPPTIDRVSPSSGHIGTTVRITGAGFSADVRCWFGIAEAKIVTQTVSRLTVLAPVAPLGVVDVIVTTAGGVAKRAGAFRYRPGRALAEDTWLVEASEV